MVYLQKLKNYYLILLIIIVQGCQNNTKKNINFSQKIDKDLAENIDFSDLERLSTDSSTFVLDNAAENFIKQWKLKGMTIAVAKDGKLVYAKGFGYADEEKNIKTKPHHLFRIASASKLVTAVGIMKLVEENKLSLQDKVFGKNGILKEYNQFIKDTLAFEIEVEHLLTHTAGWRNQLRTDPMFEPVLVANAMKVSSPITFENTLIFMLSQKGYFKAGGFYDYSNFGYCVLGKIIEKITGKDYETYMQENILSKMNIKRMKIGKNKYIDRFPNEVKYYDADNATKNLSIYSPKDSASRVYEGNNTHALGAAGGWIASSVDMLRLLCAVDGFDTKEDFLSEKSINRMAYPITKKDSLGIRVLGWKQTNKEQWWRTGNLASTSISLTRKQNGYSWVLITNTGSWRGPYLPYEMEGMMNRTIAKINFKKQDLFQLADNLENFFWE
ncbi:MAG: class A beta-lactamase-related serine hydrolase [Bacteroidetes bacterium]|nr:MAG: class A beta-lactamase-related serine hydrolase [Bacteroidota bacterium]TAG86187.1 MAG: class A beta-lactamase-related serine hydrolase [Bacteroidota bacterium]